MSINVQTDEGHQSQHNDHPTGDIQTRGHLTNAFSHDDETDVYERKGDSFKDEFAGNKVLVLRI